MGFGKDGKGQILYSRLNLQPGALAAATAAIGSDGFQGNLSEDFRIIKLEWYANYEPQATGDVLVFGIADGDLSAAEIEECLEATCFDSNDHPANERSMRAVFPIGIIGESSTGGGPTVLQGEKTLRWTFKNPEGWTWWVYNLDTSNALTTGSVLRVVSKIYGVWVP